MNAKDVKLHHIPLICINTKLNNLNDKYIQWIGGVTGMHWEWNRNETGMKREENGWIGP